MQIREDVLTPGKVYHIYNRGVNSKLVFLNSENMSFFLRKASYYLLPVFDIYAYCLMPNHFHFILQPKIESDRRPQQFKEKGLHSENSLYSKAIGKLISSYTQAFNKVYQRSGSVFESPFKRIAVETEEYLRNLIIYVHQNPADFRNHRFSSYRSIISNAETSICRERVLELFGGKNNFIICHNIEADHPLNA
ncbi:MAG: hypothetical protein EAS48_02690 [Chryseobacterium sp.]|nr:MAG: hypothetical protein EAS48_02690 [Chryseobacterium sp.]